LKHNNMHQNYFFKIYEIAIKIPSCVYKASTFYRSESKQKLTTSNLALHL
jgi:hypothetical protein